MSDSEPKGDFHDDAFSESETELMHAARAALSKWQDGKGDANDIETMRKYIRRMASVNNAAAKLGVTEKQLRSAAAMH